MQTIQTMNDLSLFLVAEQGSKTQTGLPRLGRERSEDSPLLPTDQLPDAGRGAGGAFFQTRRKPNIDFHNSTGV